MPENDNTPTLEDVARKAGVSTATVSRSLNEPEKVSRSAREKVDAAVKELGYTPNFAARFMAAKRTFTIGAIVPTMENAIFAQGLQAFQEELVRRGYTLLVASSAYDKEVEQEQIRNLVARGADGVLVIGHGRDGDIYDYLERQNVPILAAWSYDAQARAPSIGFDNHAAMRALAERMIGMGHRRIGMISGIRQDNDRVQKRVAGVRDAMAAKGLDPASLDLIEVPYRIDQGTQAFTALMQRSPRPSLVLCINDVLAVGAIRGAHRMGLAVPGDVSITGFDDMELAQVTTPELTTVRVPHRDMGRLAAEELVGMIEEKRAGVSRLLETVIVERASVGRV